ncbi:hypothetical protein AS29_014920 [Bacillus sp. SJS]|nr:hypothetical protein AS29_014920 [Bacillus sp. SJS]
MDLSRDRTRVHQRNILMVYIIWGSLLLGLAAYWITGASTMFLITLGGYGGVIGTVFTFLVMKKWLTYQLSYLAIVCISILGSIMMEMEPTIVSYLMAYYMIAVSTLYHKYKQVLLAGLLGLLMTNYFYFTHGDTMFPGVDAIAIVNLNTFMVLIVGALIFQSTQGEKMRAEAERSLDRAEESKKNSEALLAQIQDAFESLSKNTRMLKTDSDTVGQISDDLTSAFKELAAGAEAQAGSTAKIDQSLKLIGNYTESVQNSSENMKDSFNKTETSVADVNHQMTLLSEEMEKVSAIIQKVVDSIIDLQKETKDVESIVKTITRISDQTNLLALNASIEAARAGEHGKGFSVVANEIRVLAENSKQSAGGIHEILDRIIEKTNKTSEDMQLGNEAFLSSLNSSDEVTQRMNHILLTVEDVSGRAVQLQQRLDALSENTRLVMDEASSVSAVTDQTSAVIQEVLSSTEEQNTRISNMVKSIRDLEEAASALELKAGE